MNGTFKDFFIEVIKAVLFAVILTLVALLIFAFIVKLTPFSTIAVKIVNQFIKCISVFTACMFCVRREKGFLKGAIAGGLYALIIYTLFSLISKTTLTFPILELTLCLTVGLFSGVISANVTAKE